MQKGNDSAQKITSTIGARFADRARFVFPPYSYEYDRTHWEDIEIAPDAVRLDEIGWPPEHQLPEHIVKAARDCVENGSKYVHTGSLELREAIAEKLERDNGLAVDPKDELLLTNGASEAMFLSVWSLIDEGDEVIFADPGYVCGWAPNVLMSGGRMVYVPAKQDRNFRIDPRDVEGKITKRTKLIAISTPDQPTGAVPEKDDLRAISELAVDHDLVVVYDESFENIMYRPYPGSIGAVAGMEDRTITINGFAKSYGMPGYRIGYVTGPEDFIDRVARMQSHTTVCASDVGQAAALAALIGPRDWVKQTIRGFKARRDLLVDGLNKIPGVDCSKPDGFFSAFPNIRSFGMSSHDFVRYLLKEAHVKVGYGRGLWGNGSEGYVSVNFSSVTDAQISEGVRRIHAALDKL